jgi:hypothetical protein
MKYGVLSAGIIFFAWGVGYKLAFWGRVILRPYL